MFKKIKSFPNIKYLTKNKKYLNSNIANTEEIFDKNILSFFDDLSKQIFNFERNISPVDKCLIDKKDDNNFA